MLPLLRPLLAAGLGVLVLACGSATVPSATLLPPTPASTAAAAPASTRSPGPAPPTATINGVRFQLELALTPEEHARGLGYRSSLPADRGMLFVYHAERILTFWMKGMSFPIDILWVSREGHLVDVTHSVQPEPGVPDVALTLYRPQVLVAYVLEINAGLARRHGFVVEDPVTFRDLPEGLGVPGAGTNVPSSPSGSGLLP